MSGGNTYSQIEPELVDILSKVSPSPDDIKSKITELEARFGLPVYSEFLYLLCHLRFSPTEAAAHWESIQKHCDRLREKIGDLDFRVGVLDYFISVNHHLDSPKIIEIRIFQKTQDSAIRDELTGLFNYRYFQSELDRELARARRTGSSVSLAFFDVDNFKWYNDHNGHLAGDRALAAVARILSEEVRDGDLVARYGGEEFAVILPGATKPKAFEVAERIRQKIAECKVSGADEQPHGVFSVSCGVATFRADADEAAELLDAADRALYRAKVSGKNCVLSANEETREYLRVTVAVPGDIQVFATARKALRTEDLSEQGMQFRTETPIEPHAVFRFRLSLPTNEEIAGLAKAVRVSAAGGAYDVGAHFVNLEFEHTKTLRHFLGTHAGAASRDFAASEPV